MIQKHKRSLIKGIKMSEIVTKKGALLLATLIFLGVVVQSVNADTVGKSHGGKVSRAQFATKMDQREPVDDVVFIDDAATEVFFFSEILYMTGHKVIHRWEYEGKEVSRVSFDIGGPRWRVFSRKKLDENQKGKWSVMVTDEKGWPLASKVFVYGAEHKNKHLDLILHGQQGEGSLERSKQPLQQTQKPQQTESQKPQIQQIQNLQQSETKKSKLQHENSTEVNANSAENVEFANAAFEE